MHGNHIESWQSWRRGGRARASESHSMADDLGSLPSHPNSMLLQHDPDDGLPGYGGGSPTWSRRRAGDAMNRWLCACACWMPSPRACSPMWSPQVFCRFPARPAAATPPGRGCVGGGGTLNPAVGPPAGPFTLPSTSAVDRNFWFFLCKSRQDCEKDLYGSISTDCSCAAARPRPRWATLSACERRLCAWRLRAQRQVGSPAVGRQRKTVGSRSWFWRRDPARARQGRSSK
jgi:hypothetical protein